MTAANTIANPISGSNGAALAELLTPSAAEIQAALRAGYRAIDDGYGFYPGFHGWLESLGYRHQPALPCTCPDGGQRGHLPECRWVRN